MLPNFIIAGATRSGTTSLYYYLKQHPEIGFPELKEPRYFSSINLELPQKGPGDYTVDRKLVLKFHDYRELYKHINGFKRVGDASSEYLYRCDVSADAIKKKLGDIPIILILRNPIDRAFSAYSNLLRDGREEHTFEEALELEEERINNNWDMMWHYKKVGLYYEQVKRYKQVFSSVKILIFEEFVEDANSKVEETFDFLGIESTARILTLKCIPRKYLEWIGKRVLVNETIMPDTRKVLYETFQDDIRKLETLINIDLSHWQ
jgi:hypothetical protein